MCFHLFRALISFNNVLQFSEYKSCIYFVKCSPNYSFWHYCKWNCFLSFFQSFITWYFFCGTAWDWVIRMLLTHWFWMTQIVYIDKDFPEKVYLAHTCTCVLVPSNSEIFFLLQQFIYLFIHWFTSWGPPQARYCSRSEEYSGGCGKLSALIELALSWE